MSPVEDLGINILVAASLGASFSLFGVLTYTNIVMDQQGQETSQPIWSIFCDWKIKDPSCLLQLIPELRLGFSS